MSEQARQPMPLEEYVCNAMSKARYQVLEDGTYYGDIFLCPGVWAIGDTVEECREVLKGVLSEWLVSAYEGRGPMLTVTELAFLNPRWHQPGD